VSAFIEEGCREHAVSRRWPGLRADGGSPIPVANTLGMIFDVALNHQQL